MDAQAEASSSQGIAAPSSTSKSGAGSSRPSVPAPSMSQDGDPPASLILDGAASPQAELTEEPDDMQGERSASGGKQKASTSGGRRQSSHRHHHSHSSSHRNGTHRSRTELDAQGRKVPHRPGMVQYGSMYHYSLERQPTMPGVDPEELELRAVDMRMITVAIMGVVIVLAVLGLGTRNGGV